MDIDEWWPKLSGTAQAWLIANNGDAISADILREITVAGATVTSNAWWVGERGGDGFHLSDRATDWIEEIANEEH
jgi:enoyl-CoA hydratase/carnithine racemase